MEKEILIETIREFATEISVLNSDVESWKKKYSDLLEKLKQKEQEKYLDLGPSYRAMENALLAEQEHNANITKEVDRLTAILKERDAEIARYQSHSEHHQ